MKKRWLIASLATAVSVITAACGSTDGSSFSNGNDGGGGGTDDGGGSGGGSDGAFTNNHDSGPPSNGGDAGLNACAADTQQAKLAPLDLVFMQDVSGSMWETTSGTTTKWDAVKTAINTFTSDPGSAGIGLGLQYFPLWQSGVPNSCTATGECGASGGTCLSKTCSKNSSLFCNVNADCGTKGNCTGTLQRCSGDPEFMCGSDNDCIIPTSGGFYDLRPCNQPLDRGLCYHEYYGGSGTVGISCTATDYQLLAVNIATLPGVASGISTSLNNHIPNGLTPTYSALAGALNAAKTYATAHPGDIAAVVLSTDGIPNSGGGAGCDDTTADIDGLAAAALAGTPSVKTFVIGVLSPSDNTAAATSTLNGIAAAGGTSAATIIGTGSTTESDFVTALQKIRGQSLPCQFDLPVPEAGTPDYSKVNVVYTDSATMNASVVPYVADLADCAADGGANGGWYYDVDPFIDAGTPTKVVLCPATCSTVQGDPTGKVDVVQGCKTATGGGGPPR